LKEDRHFTVVFRWIAKRNLRLKIYKRLSRLLSLDKFRFCIFWCCF